MSIIEEFRDKVLDPGVESFVLNRKIYVQTYIHETKIVYMSSVWDRLVEPNHKLEIIAIVKDGTVYLMKTYEFVIDEKNGLPEKIRYFRDYMNEELRARQDEVYKKFMDGLLVYDVSKDMIEDYGIISDARRELLLGKKRQKVEPKNLFTEREAIDDLLGVKKIEEDIEKYLTENTDIYQRRKSLDTALIKMIEEKACVEDWEMKLGKAISSVDAVKLTVKFKFAGLTEMTKIKKETLMRKLVNRDDFSSWDFETQAEGEMKMRYLGADYNNKLYCKHIAKITYGRKVLYEV